MKNVCKFLLLIFSLSAILNCEKNEYKIFGTGTFEARKVIVSAQAAGVILEMFVEEGQAVQKDRLIARIDVEKLVLQKQQIEAALDEVKLSSQLARKQVQQARIQYDHLKTRFERFSNLLKEKSIAQQQLDDLQSQLEIAEKNLESARIHSETTNARQRQLEAQMALLERQITDGTVYSPLDGVVLQKFKESGEMVIIGGSLVQIANLEQMEITIYVSEFDLGYLKLGQTLSIAIDSFPEKLFQGRISWISPNAEFTPKNVQTKDARVNLVYAVKLLVENPNGELKIGMPAEVFLK